MKRLNRRDFIKRTKFKLKEQKNYILKFLVFQTTDNISIKKNLNYQITKFKNYSKTLVKNRCIITGRSRSISRKLKLSRIMLKYNINKLNITNIRKQNN